MTSFTLLRVGLVSNELPVCRKSNANRQIKANLLKRTAPVRQGVARYVNLTGLVDSLRHWFTETVCET
ncbi:MAG: hypothetical protein DWQ31_02295 [Planctomycetota bacterium]|nr:MAG: hypothetical protein DWQ31_02295 [Planctomycetota bacterium]